MKNIITPIDITHMHTDVECGGVSHRYRRCTRMLRADGKDVIRNLKKKSVLICDICGRLISSCRWWLPQIARMSTDVGYINLIIHGICGRINIKLQMVAPTDSTDAHRCGIYKSDNPWHLWEKWPIFLQSNQGTP